MKTTKKRSAQPQELSVIIKDVSEEALNRLEADLNDYIITGVSINVPTSEQCSASLITFLEKQRMISQVRITCQTEPADRLNSLVLTQRLPALQQLINDLFDVDELFDVATFCTNAHLEELFSSKLKPARIRAIVVELLNAFKPSKLISINLDPDDSDEPFIRGQPLTTFLTTLAIEYLSFFSQNPNQQEKEARITQLTEEFYHHILNILVNYNSTVHKRLEPNTLMIYLLREWYVNNLTEKRTEEQKTFALVKTYLYYSEITFSNMLQDFISNPVQDIFNSKLQNILYLLEIKVDSVLQNIEPQDKLAHTQLSLNTVAVKISFFNEIYFALEEKGATSAQLTPWIRKSYKNLTQIEKILARVPPSIRAVALNAHEDWDGEDAILEMIVIISDMKNNSAEFIKIIEILFPRTLFPIEKSLSIYLKYADLYQIAAKAYSTLPDSQAIAEQCYRRFLSCLAKPWVICSDERKSQLINDFAACVPELAQFDETAKLVQEMLEQLHYDPEFFVSKLNELKSAIIDSPFVTRSTGYDLVRFMLEYTDYIKSLKLSRNQLEQQRIPMLFIFLSSEPHFNIENLRNFIPDLPNRVPSMVALMQQSMLAVAKEIGTLQKQQKTLSQECEQLEQESVRIKAHVGQLNVKKRLREQADPRYTFFLPEQDCEEHLAKRQKLNPEGPEAETAPEADDIAMDLSSAL